MPKYSSPTPVILIFANGTMPLLQLSEAMRDLSTTLFTCGKITPECVSMSPEQWSEYIGRHSKNTRPTDVGAHFLLDGCSEKNVLQAMVDMYQVLALKKGRSFAVVSLSNKKGESDMAIQGASSKIPTSVEVDIAGLPNKAVAANIVKNLVDVLPIPERLHFIPSSQLALQPLEQVRFPGATYCTLEESKNRKRSDQIIFVALILTQPRVSEDNTLRWKAIDHTRIADFFFRWEGEGSRYTWNLVLGWKPGERQLLPRAPLPDSKGRSGLKGVMVDIPMRAVATTCEGMGGMLGSTAKVFSRAGKRVRKILQHKVKEEKKTQGKNLEQPSTAQRKANLGKNEERIVPSAPTEKERGVSVSNVEVDEAWDEKASTVAGSEYTEETVKLHEESA